MGKHDLIIRFQRDARRLNPPRSHLVPSWDLLVILAGPQKGPFELLVSVELKYSTCLYTEQQNGYFQQRCTHLWSPWALRLANLCNPEPIADAGTCS